MIIKRLQKIEQNLLQIEGGLVFQDGKLIAPGVGTKENLQTNLILSDTAQEAEKQEMYNDIKLEQRAKLSKEDKEEVIRKIRAEIMEKLLRGA